MADVPTSVTNGDCARSIRNASVTEGPRVESLERLAKSATISLSLALR